MMSNPRKPGDDQSGEMPQPKQHVQGDGNEDLGLAGADIDGDGFTDPDEVSE